MVHICRVAKQGALDALSASVPGRPGQSAEATELAEARTEIERLRATVTEQAVALHLHQGKWGVEWVSVGGEMFKGGLGVDRLPEDDDVDHDAEAVELVFLPGLVVLAELAALPWKTSRAWRRRNDVARLTPLGHPTIDSPFRPR